MIILSLFDGMSCGQIALERSGIKVDKYYASEIDKYAQIVSKANYPDIIRLGDITKWREWDIEQPDIIIGGSPCQSFSFAGKRKGMSTTTEIKIETLEQYQELKNQGYEFEGQSYLFWEYVAILEHYKPKYFLLENVRMTKDWENIISLAVGVQPTLINSALLSAQNRQRLYWTNINAKKDLFGEMLPGIDQPEDKKIYLKDIIKNNVGKQFELSEQRKNYQLKTDRSRFVNIESKKAGSILASHDSSDMIIFRCGAIRGRNPENPKSREAGLNTEQQLEIRKDEKTNCLTSVQKDNVVVTKNYLQYKTSEKHDNQQSNRLYKKSGKMGCLSSSFTERKILEKDDDNITWRKLTPIECERLQTVPDNYTNHVSNLQRYKMLGNGWTVDVIVHILKEVFND